MKKFLMPIILILGGAAIISGLITGCSGEEGADGVWESKNQGESWSKVFDYQKDAISGSGCYLSGAALSVGGDIFYIVEDDSDMTGEGYREGELKRTYWSMDKDGNSTELPMTSLKQENQEIFLNTFEFTDDNNILGIDTQGKIYVVDVKNNKLIWTIQDSKERFESYAMFYVNKKGIYTHLLGGSIVEQLVDNSLTSLAMPGLGYLRIAVMEDNSFFVTTVDCDNRYEIFRYTYSEMVDSKPQTRVKAYSLRDSPELRQSVIKFQNKNPDIFISLEIGVDGEQSGASVSDALRALNTEIMAGNGPDILLLDGLPVNSYIEKGLLTDLSQIVKTNTM